MRYLALGGGKEEHDLLLISPRGRASPPRFPAQVTRGFQTDRDTYEGRVYVNGARGRRDMRDRLVTL